MIVPGSEDRIPAPAADRSAERAASGAHRDVAGPRGRLGNIVFYGLIRGGAEVLRGGRGLLLAAILGPTAFGGWTLFSLARRYAVFAELAIGRGLELEVSRAETDSTGQPGPEAVRYGRSAMGFVTALFATIGLGSFVASFFVGDAVVAFTLRLLGPAIVAERLWAYAVSYLRALGLVRVCGRLELVCAALHLGVTVLLAFAWGLEGAICGFVLSAALALLLMVRWVPLRPALSKRRLGRMLRVGMPMALTIIVTTALGTVDHIVVAGEGGTALLGMYAFGVALAGPAASLAWVVRTVVFPDVYRGARQSGPDRAVDDLLRETVLPFALLFPPLLGAAALVLGPAVATFVPQYGDAVGPARLLLFTAGTSAFQWLGVVGMIAASRERLLPVFALVASLLNTALAYAALHFGAGIAGVALGSLASRALYGAAILATNASAARIASPLRFVGRMLLPLFYCAALVQALVWAWPCEDWLPTFAALLVYLVFLLPLAFLVRGEVGELVRRARLSVRP